MFIEQVEAELSEHADTSVPDANDKVGVRDWNRVEVCIVRLGFLLHRRELSADEATENARMLTPKTLMVPRLMRASTIRSNVATASSSEPPGVANDIMDCSNISASKGS